MKKQSQVGTQSYTAPQAIQSLKSQIKTMIEKLDPLMRDLPVQLNTAMESINQLDIQVKQLEQMRFQLQQSQQQAQQADDTDLTSEAKKKSKHPVPRDSTDTKDLPDFWRENYDYGESPYMNLDKIEKITDKPPLSKRVKKKKSK